MTASPTARFAGPLVVFAAVAAAARAAAATVAAVAVVVPDELHPPAPCQLAATVAILPCRFFHIECSCKAPLAGTGRGKTLPLPCVSTAFATKAALLPCVSTAFATRTHLHLAAQDDVEVVDEGALRAVGRRIAIRSLNAEWVRFAGTAFMGAVCPVM